MANRYGLGLEADAAETPVVSPQQVEPIPAVSIEPLPVQPNPGVAIMGEKGANTPTPTPVQAEPTGGMLEESVNRYGISAGQGQPLQQNSFIVKDEALRKAEEFEQFVTNARENIPVIYDAVVDWATGKIDFAANASTHDLAQAAVDAQWKQTGMVLSASKGALETGAHALQIPLDFLAVGDIGFTPDDANNFARATRRELENFNTELASKFGDAPEMQWAETGGEYGIVFAFPATLLGTKLGSGMFKMMMDVGKGSVGGSFGAMVMQQLGPELDGELEARMAARFDPAVEGALLGGAVGSVAGFLNALKRFSTRGLGSYADDPFVKRGYVVDEWMTKTFNEISAESRVNKILENHWFDSAEAFAKENGWSSALSTKQIFNSVWVDSAAQSAASRMGVAQAARNLKESQSAWMGATLDKIIKQVGNADGFGDNTLKAINEGVDALRKGRSANAKANFKLVKDEVNKFGEALGHKNSYSTARVIPQHSVQEVVEDEIRKLSVGGLSTPGREAKLEAIARMNDPTKTRLTIEELENELSRWSKASMDGADEWQKILSPKESARIAKRIYGARIDDMNTAIQSNIPGAAFLKDARDVYKVDSDALRAVQETVLGKFFEGGKTGIKNGDDLEKAIRTMAVDNPTNLEKSLVAVEKFYPGMRGDLKAFWLNRFLTKATHRRDPKASFSINTFDPGKFLDMLDGDNLKVYNKMFTGAERETVNMAVEAVQRINISISNGGAAWVSRLKGAAGVAVSGDPTFASRLAAEMLAPRYFSKFANSKEGLKALNTLTEPYDAVKWGAAIGALAELTGIVPYNALQLTKMGYDPSALEVLREQSVPQGGISQ